MGCVTRCPNNKKSPTVHLEAGGGTTICGKTLHALHPGPVTCPMCLGKSTSGPIDKAAASAFAAKTIMARYDKGYVPKDKYCESYRRWKRDQRTTKA